MMAHAPGNRRLGELLPALAQVVCHQEVRVARRSVSGDNRTVVQAMDFADQRLKICRDTAVRRRGVSKRAIALTRSVENGLQNLVA